MILAKFIIKCILNVFFVSLLLLVLLLTKKIKQNIATQAKGLTQSTVPLPLERRSRIKICMTSLLTTQSILGV